MIIYDKDKGFCPDIRQVVLQTYDIYALEKTMKGTLPFSNHRMSLEDILYDFLDDPDVCLNSYFYTCEGSGRHAIMKSDYAQIVDILKNCIMFNKNKPGITFNNIDFLGITLDADNDNIAFSITRSLRTSCAKPAFDNIIFHDAIFTNCDFDRATCIRINFLNTTFINTAFHFSKFISCSFTNTNFCESNSYKHCDFYDSDFCSVTNPPYVPLACPSEGSFIGWKKARSIDNFERVLIKLYIPADAKRSSATSKKCRCSKAKVLDITTLDGKKHTDKAMSFKDPDFIYKVGEYVIPDWFDPNRFCECACGIHFFINKQDAINF